MADAVEPDTTTKPEEVAVEVVPVPVAKSTDPTEGDDTHVQSLKVQLAAFAKAVNRSGNKPDDFKPATKLCLQFTKYVIQYPKVNVLDTLLAFFEENVDTVCAPTIYLQGSTTLGWVDEQQVAYLYGLFSDLANKRVVKVNTGYVLNVFKKPEILNYYQRKIAYLNQQANG